MRGQMREQYEQGPTQPTARLPQPLNEAQLQTAAINRLCDILEKGIPLRFTLEKSEYGQQWIAYPTTGQ